MIQTGHPVLHLYVDHIGPKMYGLDLEFMIEVPGYNSE